MWKIRCALLLVFLGLSAHAAAPTPRRAAPFVTIRIRSAENLIAASRHLTRLYDAEVEARELKPLFDQLSNKQPLAKIFPTGKPLFIYIPWPPDAEPTGHELIIVPITEPKAFRNAVSRTYGLVFPAGGGLFRASPAAGLAGAPTLYIRFAHGHAYLASTVAGLKGSLPLPDRLATGFDKKNLLDVTLHPSAIPPVAIRQMVADFSADAEQEQPQPGESDLVFKLRKNWMKNLGIGVRDLFTGTDTLRLALRLDSKQNRLQGELVCTPVTGSSLARTFEGLGKQATQFQGLLERSHLGFSVCLPVKDLFPLKMGLHMFQEAIDYTVASRDKISLRRLVRALEPTLEEGILDAAILMPYQKENEWQGILLAMRLKNARAMENLLRDHAKDQLLADRLGLRMRWNRTREGSLGIHSITFKGQHETFVAFKGDSILLSSHLPQLRAALTELKKARPTPVAMRFKASTSDVALMTYLAMASSDPKWVERLLKLQKQDEATKLFKGELRKENKMLMKVLATLSGKGEEMAVDLRLEGGKDFRLTFELNTRLLRIFKLLDNPE